MSSDRHLLVLNERDPLHPRAGGAELHVERICQRLVERGHQITWHSTSFRGSKARETISGISIERRGPLPLYYAGLPARIRSQVAAGGFDLVLECLNKVPFYAPLYAGVPVLALCHHLFGRVAFEQVAWPIALGVVASESAIPLVYRNCPFVAISQSTAEDLRRRGIASERIRVSPPGVDRPALSVDPDSPRPSRLTYVGRLERYKRVDLLLRVGARLIQEYPDLELSVLGQGPERSRLEALANELGISARTRFYGFVPDADRDALLAQSRLCLFPSEKEGWGLTVIEANALGTPVVARDAPGLRDSIRDGETGWLVQNAPSHGEEVERWLKVVTRAFSENDRTREMRRNCLGWSKRFDWERATDELERAVEWSIKGEPT